MGILSRLVGKKKDELGLSDMGQDYGQQPQPNYGDPLRSPDPNYGMPQSPGIPTGSLSPEAMGFERVPSSTPSYPPQPQTVGEINVGKDLEIISAKLDAIKAELDAMSQRLKKIERIADGETTEYKNKWNY